MKPNGKPTGTTDLDIIAARYGIPERMEGWYTARELAPSFGVRERNTLQKLKALVEVGEFESMRARVNGRTCIVFKLTHGGQTSETISNLQKHKVEGRGRGKAKGRS